MASTMISQAAIDLIVSEEIGSKALYERRWRHPVWPEGASGITVGIGYDCGYRTADDIRHDWSGVLPPEQVQILASCAGLTGQHAQARLPQVKFQVDVPIDDAMHVFDNLDVPRWTTITINSLRNCDLLSPDCLGALVSLSYNRGASYNMLAPRYREMNNIKQHMIAKEFHKIPAEFRSMKRLWTNGLVNRRESEARLFERGLAVMAGKRPRAMELYHKQVNRDAAIVACGSGSSIAIGGLSSSAVHDLTFYAIVCAGIVLSAVAGWSAIKIPNRFKRSPRADPL